MSRRKSSLAVLTCRLRLDNLVGIISGILFIAGAVSVIYSENHPAIFGIGCSGIGCIYLPYFYGGLSLLLASTVGLLYVLKVARKQRSKGASG